LSAAEGHCVLVQGESPPKAPETLASYWTSVFGSVRFARVNVESASSIPAALWALLRARLRVWFVRTRTFRSSSIYGQRVVVRGRLRDLRGHGVQGARIDVYHLRRTGKHRRLVKTGLKTRAHGDLTLILPLNVDTRRIESLPRAATGADHQPPDAASDGHAPRNGVRADAEVARDGPARRRRQRLGRIVVGHSPAWGQTTRTEDPGTGSENRVREPPCHPRGGHRRAPPRSLETPVAQIQGVPARARGFRPGVTEVAPTPMGRAHVPGL
jgi:hypothetical protein